MLKRPSSRRKSAPEGITLNLVPVLDAMVTLIAFLLFTMSFLNLASVESQFPQASPQDVQEKLKDKPLQLTLTLRENETEVWSPFELIPSKTIPNSAPGIPDTRAIHLALIDIKQKFPTETKVVMVPQPAVNYDTLVAVMDAARLMEKSDTPVFFKNPTTGVDEVAKVLFPDVIFGNLLGDV